MLIIGARKAASWLGLTGAGLLALGGCAGPIVYVPTEQVASEVRGFPASRYPVPPEAPHGDVTVSSRGLATLEAQGGKDRRKMLHVGVILSNDDDSAPWQIDGRQQKLYVGASQLSPALVSAGQGITAVDPVITVAPGQKREVDLFFAPPPGFDERAVGGFDAFWTVATPERRVSERTPFERRQMQPGYGVPTVAVGFGPVWWYDPLYAPYYAYYPPVIHYGFGYPYHHGYVPGGYGRPPNVAPPAYGPPMPGGPYLSAPVGGGPPAPAPPMPTQPHLSAPAPR